MFLLVPAYPGCPGSKAVKRSLLLLLLLMIGDSGIDFPIFTIVIHYAAKMSFYLSIVQFFYRVLLSNVYVHCT